MPDPLDYQIVRVLRCAGEFTPNASRAQCAIELAREQLQREAELEPQRPPSSRWSGGSAGPWPNRLRRWPALSAVAAAVVLMVVWIFADFGRPSVALADVTRMLKSLRSIRYTTSIDKGQGPATESRTMISGRDLVRTEYADGHVFVLDRTSGHSLQLFPDEKRAIVRFDGIPGEDMFDVVDSLQRERQVSRILPEQLIDGTPAIGFVLGNEQFEHVVWVDPRSRLLVRWETTAYGKDGTITRHVHEDFAYNEPLSAALFDLTPPSGYRVEHQGVLELAPPTEDALQSPTLHVTQGIGPATFGMPREEVMRVFGPPDEIDERPQSLRYPSRGLELLVAPGRGLWGVICRTQAVAPERTRDYSGRTDKGIGMGATAEEIIAAYGPPDERVTTSTAETLSYKGQHLHFSLHGGALVLITHDWIVKRPTKSE